MGRNYLQEILETEINEFASTVRRDFQKAYQTDILSSVYKVLDDLNAARGSYKLASLPKTEKIRKERISKGLLKPIVEKRLQTGTYDAHKISQLTGWPARTIGAYASHWKRKEKGRRKR